MIYRCIILTFPWLSHAVINCSQAEDKSNLSIKIFPSQLFSMFRGCPWRERSLFTGGGIRKSRTLKICPPRQPRTTFLPPRKLCAEISPPSWCINDVYIFQGMLVSGHCNHESYLGKVQSLHEIIRFYIEIHPPRQRRQKFFRVYYCCLRLAFKCLCTEILLPL